MNKKEIILKILNGLYENSKLLRSGDLGITEELWNEIIDILMHDNFIFGLNFTKPAGRDRHKYLLNPEDAKITIIGIEYLEHSKSQ